MEYTVAFLSLGCKVNAYEIEVYISQFKKEGFNIVDFGEQADITIINTCTVTGMADRKSRKMIHKAKKISPNGLIIAVGCYVQLMSAFDRKKEDIVDLFIDNKDKENLIYIIKKYIDKNCIKKDNMVNVYFNYINDKDFNKKFILTETTNHTRAYIKIQDGCNQFCSYCLIPYARGRVRSKNLNLIKEEFEWLLKNGYQEIVLIGINISSYGIDKYNLSLINVIKEISSLQSRYYSYRLRLGSLEPSIITTEFLNELKSIREFCPHFHLSIQSGCDKILKAMNRKYKTIEFKEKCDLIRRYWDDVALTTDIIVGFPGETDKDFESTCRFVEDINFAKIHIFKYSKRKGTIAANRLDQISADIKRKRSKILSKIDSNNRKNYIDRFKGKKLNVLIERSKCIDGKYYDVGYTKEYLRVMIPIDKKNFGLKNNKCVNIKLDNNIIVL